MYSSDKKRALCRIVVLRRYFNNQFLMKLYMDNQCLKDNILKLNQVKSWETVYNNPVIKTLLSFIPVFGTGIDSKIHNILEKQKDKWL